MKGTGEQERISLAMRFMRKINVWQVVLELYLFTQMSSLVCGGCLGNVWKIANDVEFSNAMV